MPLMGINLRRNSPFTVPDDYTKSVYLSIPDKTRWNWVMTWPNFPCDKKRKQLSHFQHYRPCNISYQRIEGKLRSHTFITCEQPLLPRVCIVHLESWYLSPRIMKCKQRETLHTAFFPRCIVWALLQLLPSTVCFQLWDRY